MKSICRAESILSALPKSLGKSNVIEAFDRSYPQSTLMTELAKPTNLARWAILAYQQPLHPLDDHQHKKNLPERHHAATEQILASLPPACESLRLHTQNWK